MSAEEISDRVEKTENLGAVEENSDLPQDFAVNQVEGVNHTYVSMFAGSAARKYVAYTVKLPSDQLAALQSIWLELKRLYGAHSPDKSGMIQQAITEWLRKWDGPERQELLRDLLNIREDTRRRQYRK